MPPRLTKLNLINKFFLFLIIFVLSSCCGLHTEVDYKYEDVIIKRVDVCGKTTFHYQNKLNDKAGIIWVNYSGINDGFSGYLVFKENGKVELLAGDGYFQSANLDTTVFSLGETVAYDRPKDTSNICVINLATRYEQEFNSKRKSRIEFNYQIDENEWW
ncbi:hypothetical protein KEM09_21530 [Carboxylicivirga mesophila]|uniref:DUF4369 domain-containing protein n=1 Tax=Carboxylicivirga mesophila TaxID=1166478 RepID=A0ABS5KG07_9BACT|nr:hypothetical protein [Carboxylicivirga mesophila]MBS2214005.1 hypothetical protein [Carboxylicivirga mesophila]